ncbi:flavin reductase family protein [Paenarthrobacter sp. NPDC056912]|uniref:flavin reductase family protein n=1 Tax=Paenarthrobacter sp. NPDC056912 TaxID=3345965 RepID=UPI00366AFAE7
MNVTPNDLTEQPSFREVLGHHATGVALVAAMSEDGLPVGMIVGTFTSVSLTPPLVGFLPGHASTSWPKIRAAGRFAVNVLSDQQAWICTEFSRRHNKDKFADIPWTLSEGGSPLIEGCVAWVDCSLADVHEAGDHDIAVGRVLNLGTGNSMHRIGIEEDQSPLLFHKGGYGRFERILKPANSTNQNRAHA